MKRKHLDASAFFLIAILAIALCGVGAAFYFVAADHKSADADRDSVQNVLFIFEHNGKPAASYVLFLYAPTKKAAVFDIPGEVGLVVKASNRVDRIDSVYSPNRRAAYEREITGLLGVEIKHTIVFDMQTLARVIDLISGVDIFIPNAIARYGEALALFPMGENKLDGEKGSAYFVYEDENTEIEELRTRRQQFFTSFLRGLCERNAFLKKPEVNLLYEEMLVTTLSGKERRDFFNALASIDIDRLSIQTVGGITRQISGQRLLIPSYDGSLIKEIVRQTLGSLRRQVQGSGEKVYTVEVLNGTKTSGLAGRTAELLRSFGYDVVNIGNAEGVVERTEIINRTGRQEEAETFGAVLRCTNIREEAETSLKGQEDENIIADFTLLIGRDFNGRYTQ